jgi:predicted nucleic acid-binding Zn ribbon protein
MVFCTECGAKVPEGKKFCTECGNPVNSVKPPVQETAQTESEAEKTETVETVHTAAPAAAAVASPINTDEQSPPGPFAVMSVSGFVVSSILMAIPVIGWLICIIWACGGCKNHNRRNFARSYLIFLAIGAAIGLVLYFMRNWLISRIVEMFIRFILDYI